MANPGDKMTRVCTVKSIDKDATIPYADASKGTYNGVELIYNQDFNGQKELKTKNFAMKSLDHPANSAMRSALMQLEKGSTFTAHYERGEKYWDLKNITLGAEAAASAAPARSGGGNAGGGFVKKDAVSADNKSGISDYELGIVTGHALNNAVLLLGEGATIAQVKAKAHEFLAMAIEFKEEVKSGNIGGAQKAADDIPQMAPKKSAQVPAPTADFDDTIPF